MYPAEPGDADLMYSSLFSSVTWMFPPSGFSSWVVTSPRISLSTEKNISRPHSSMLLSLRGQSVNVIAIMVRNSSGQLRTGSKQVRNLLTRNRHCDRTLLSALTLTPKPIATFKKYIKPDKKRQRHAPSLSRALLFVCRQTYLIQMREL